MVFIKWEWGGKTAPARRFHGDAMARKRPSMSAGAGTCAWPFNGLAYRSLHFARFLEPVFDVRPIFHAIGFSVSTQDRIAEDEQQFAAEKDVADELEGPWRHAEWAGRDRHDPKLKNIKRGGDQIAPHENKVKLPMLRFGR